MYILCIYMYVYICICRIYGIIEKDITLFLTILAGKNFTAAQKFVKIESWLFLISLICLFNQLRSLHSHVTYYGIHLFKQGDSPYNQV